MMPAWVEQCKNSILKDPSFKPLAGKTPEESAYAICQAQYNKMEATAGQIEKQGNKK